LFGVLDDLVNGSWHGSPQVLALSTHRMDHDRALSDPGLRWETYGNFRG
jgi:lactoylglutathione lyase